MPKKLIFLVTFIFTIIISQSAAFGDSFLGEKVNIRIESYDKTLLNSQMYGYAFSDVLRSVSESGKLNITVTNGDKFAVSSVGDIENGYFGGNDKWLAYIERGDEIITGDSVMEMNLINGDKLVLYYGEEGKTLILTDFDITHDGESTWFFTGAKNDVWEQIDGKWLISHEPKAVSGVRISVKVPNGNYRMLRTDESGQVTTKFSQTGVYIYSAEGYNGNEVPNIAATEKYYFLYGAEDNSAVTRGEAVSYVVSLFRFYQGKTDVIFDDLKENHKRYEDINTAVSRGIAVGMGDGTFMPDDKVKLYELCRMLANASKLQAKTVVEYRGVPEWANEGVNICIQNGLLNNVELNWQNPVNSDILIQIYKNKNSL